MKCELLALFLLLSVPVRAQQVWNGSPICLPQAGWAIDSHGRILAQCNWRPDPPLFLKYCSTPGSCGANGYCPFTVLPDAGMVATIQDDSGHSTTPLPAVFAEAGLTLIASHHVLRVLCNKTSHISFDYAKDLCDAKAGVETPCPLDDNQTEPNPNPDQGGLGMSSSACAATTTAGSRCQVVEYDVQADGNLR